MKKIQIHVREHSARLLKEKSSEQLDGTIDIIPSHMQLFTAADLSLPSHCIYRIAGNFRGTQFS